MKKHEINFLQTTTIEHLQDKIPCCYGGALTFGEKVLVTMVNWRGQYEAAIYEFIETPEETGLGRSNAGSILWRLQMKLSRTADMRCSGQLAEHKEGKNDEGNLQRI